MPEIPNAVCAYLAPSASSFWKWRDGGQVVAWADDTTIAFRAELEEVVARLAPQGLPPFDALLLLLAATRDSWLQCSHGPTTLPSMIESCADKVAQALQVVRGQLDRVHDLLPPALRTPPAAKAELADLVFERCRHRGPADLAADVLKTLRDGVPENICYPFVLFVPPLSTGSTDPGEVPPALDISLKDLYCLLEGLPRVDAGVLALRLETGLPALPEPADVDVSPAEQARALIARLEADDELGALGRLARHLMAAVTLPRAVSDREDLPVGGVSDISNRGPLDRLLLSELAHDDLTLAVRVANGEALYLRREQPPRTPPRQRAVLLESGLRSWGVPRVFATAVALALAATTDRNTRVVCYRAKGRGVVPVDLGTREGLVAHLAALEPEAHPGAALAAFQAAVAESDDPADAVLVTTEDVLADRDFQRALAACELLPLHVATVRRDGAFQLLLRSALGVKVLRTATLDLEGLFKQKESTTVVLLDRDRPRVLPAILSVRPFPLLVPHQINAMHAWLVPGAGLHVVTPDRRLTLWTDRAHGPAQLTDSLPPGDLLWASPELHEGTAVAVVGRQYAGQLHLVTAGPAGVKATLFGDRGGHCKGVCSHGGVLFAVYDRRVEAFSLPGGQRLAGLGLPEGLAWHRDRFFRDAARQRWYALAFDGLGPRLELLLDADDRHGRMVVTLYEGEKCDGAIGVTVDGHLYFTARKHLARVEHGLQGPVGVEAVARAGDRLVLGERPGKPCRFVGIDVDGWRTHAVSGDPAAWVERVADYASPVSLRCHFTHVGLDRSKVLTLTTRKGSQLRIDYELQREILTLGPDHPADGLGRVAFRPEAAPLGSGYTLHAATWADGSKAWLDSRGLLHLQSADLSIPEATLVLTDGPLAGWCSDGRVWGVPYFTRGQGGGTPRAAFFSALLPFARQLT